MEQSLLIFESSPFYLVLCALFAAGLAAWFYLRGRISWSRRTNLILFLIRSVLLFFVTVLLLSPILKYLQNQIEEPIAVVAIDNSKSISAVLDSVQLEDFKSALGNTVQGVTDNGYDLRIMTYNGNVSDLGDIEFDHNNSNLAGLVKKVEDQFEGQNMQNVILISDGIYNNGASPSYSSWNFNLHTIGLGDSIPKKDITIQSVRYNKVSYQGNRFPIQVSVLNEGFVNSSTTVSLRKDNEVIDSRRINFENNQEVNIIDFMVDAAEEGTQQLDIIVQRLEGEYTGANNSKTIFIEVVEGKEDILLISERPHPDIKALRESIESNTNYSFESYIRGIDKSLEKKDYDLIICHQCTGKEGFIASMDIPNLEETPLWIFYGKQMSNSSLGNTEMIVFEPIIDEYDAVTPVTNSAFTGFSYSDELNQLMRDLPPVIVPFGDISTEFDTESLLFQRVGSIETPKPLLVIKNSEPRTALMLGEGIWRWKLHDFLRNENNELFIEFVSKIVQFLSTREEEQKLRVNPIQNEFSDRRVVLETEIYNELYERIYDIPVNLIVTDENGNSKEYTYATGSTSSQYRINDLESGIYTYQASASVGNQVYRTSGRFIINELQLEYLNLTADFRLLQTLSRENGGRYFSTNEVDGLTEVLNEENAKGVIHSYEAYDPLINLPWLLGLILLLASTEWFIRKYYGVY